MKNVLILQTDNRNLDYLGLTIKLSKFICKHMTENQHLISQAIENDSSSTPRTNESINYNYLFVDMNKYTKENMNPCTTKIYVLNDILNTSIANTTVCTTTEVTKTVITTQTHLTTFLKNQTNEGNSNNEVPNVSTIIEKKNENPTTVVTITNNNYDLIVFLDSDAWIQDFYNLHRLVLKLLFQENIQGCYSRDPYIRKNTYINSGSFIIKVNDYTKNMYKTIIQKLEEENSHWDNHPYDQYYISKYIYDNKKDFWVFKPPILNTPLGSILRHNWWKTHKMYADLYNLLDYFHTNKIPTSSPEINLEDVIDNEVYPNPNEEGYIYFH